MIYAGDVYVFDRVFFYGVLNVVMSYVESFSVFSAVYLVSHVTNGRVVTVYL